MKHKNQLNIFTHQYPTWLLKRPGWIRLFYALTYITQLRKWYINSKLKSIFASSNSSYSLLDAGCGEGQYLFPYAETNSKSTFKGIDRLESNVAFCKKYAEAKKLQNVSFQTVEIEHITDRFIFDIVLCLSVLPYCKDDKIALEKMNHSMKENGKLILYVSVNDKSVLPFYKTTNKKFSNYESIQHNLRTYSASKVLALINDCGFTVLQKKYTYGFFGILSNELINLHFILFNQAILPLKLIIGLSFLLFIPIILICMIVDFCIPLRNGNGMLIIATNARQ